MLISEDILLDMRSQCSRVFERIPNDPKLFYALLDSVVLDVEQMERAVLAKNTDEIAKAMLDLLQSSVSILLLVEKIGAVDQAG